MHGMTLAVLMVLALWCAPAWGQGAPATPRGTLNIGLHFGLDPGWFVHAVTQKVLPEGEAVHHYWDTHNAPFPWPWEVWEVKG